MSEHAPQNVSGKKLLFLSLAALGVVYGDIGTSPLYAISEVFFGHANIELIAENIYGCIGLVLWSLTLVISLKYIVYVLRADNDGEGGVFALSSLVALIKTKSRAVVIVSTLLIFAAGLLFGDGMITPAISVISAVEGLKIVTKTFDSYVVPITVAILTVLFGVQRFGTAKVGRVFGPIIFIWFITIGLLGFMRILEAPDIFNAINPLHIFTFVKNASFHQLLLVMGSVMLSITGGEALYADLGHFGQKPIRASWFTIVYPMLLLNYMGQGAYLLSGHEVINHSVFYSMVPSSLLLPVVILATMAAVIASQALISGVFSLISQAVALGYFPLITIINTHHEQEGQKYVPFANWFLYFGAVALVLVFKSSSNLASAYGLAVSADMLITTLGMVMVTYYLWKWSKLKILALLGPFVIIDLLFISANSLKLFQGGYIPLTVGILIMIVMRTWNWGKKKQHEALEKYPTMTLKDLLIVKTRVREQLPRSIVIMTPNYISEMEDRVPVLEQEFIERYGLLPQHVIFLTVKRKKIPFVHGERYEVLSLFEDKVYGSVVSVKLNFGFMEDPNVEARLKGLAEKHLLHISEHHSEWLIHVLDDKLRATAKTPFGKSLLVKFFQFMENISISTADYFKLGNRVRLSQEVLTIQIRK